MTSPSEQVYDYKIGYLVLNDIFEIFSKISIYQVCVGVNRVVFKTLKSRSVSGAVLFGVLISLVTGLLERHVISILEVRYYGFPLIWRITNLNGPTEYVLTNFTIDTLIWAAVSLLVFFLSQMVKNLQITTPTNFRSDKEVESNERKFHAFFLYFLALAFLMKVAGEFVHEVLGHGMFALLFGGRIVEVNISLLWPYRLSGIEISGNFEDWQQLWIDGGGILICLIVSCIIQVLLWKLKNWHFTAPLFWLAFWTSLNPAGYLIIGGIKPFGDILDLISKGILSQSEYLVIGLLVFSLTFFSLSGVLENIVRHTGFIRNKKLLRAFISILWLTIPFVTLMAITGLGFLRSYSLTLFAISFIPSLVALVLPENLLSTVKNRFSYLRRE